MTFSYLRQVTLIGALLQLTAGQQSTIIPEDLRSGFVAQGTEVQVSYTNRAVDGFKDGTLFTKDAVSKEPTFALGDSSGISPSTLYTIIMIDTTCPNKRILHYARANFKNNLDITNIATQSAALLDYKPPGSLGETGDKRQYSFLMYVNPNRKQIDKLQLPAEGAAFDAKKFQTDNGLRDATAGVAMVVNLGGTVDCGGDQPNKVPDTLPSAQPAPSSNAQTPSTPTSSPSNGNAPAPSGARPSGSAAPSNGAGASGVASASPNQQTANAASGSGLDGLGHWAPLFAVAGFFVW